MTVIDKIRQKDYTLPKGYGFVTIESKRKRRIRYIKEAFIGATLSFGVSYFFVLMCLAYGPLVGYAFLALGALGALTINTLIA